MAADGINYTLREVILELNRRFDALDAKLDAVLKDFAGFERRVALHEQLPGHPTSIERLTALEHDVRGLQVLQQARRAVEEYLKDAAQEAAEQRRATAALWRWALALGLTTALELATLLFKVFGVIGP